MPFKKIGPGVYQSPSGRKYNEAQVRLYYSGTQPGFRPENEVNNLVNQYKQIAQGGKAFAKKTRPQRA